MQSATERHIEAFLKHLDKDLYEGFLKPTSTTLVYREAVSRASKEVSIVTPNKHNRIYLKVEPLCPTLLQKYTHSQTAYDHLIEQLDDQQPALTRLLVEQLGVDPTEAKAVLAFGGASFGANMLVDGTEGCQFLEEIKRSLAAALSIVASASLLTEEKCHGLKVTITDAYLVADAIHRGGGQMIPAVRRGICAAMLSAGTVLLEPIYEVQLYSLPKSLDATLAFIKEKKGTVSTVAETGPALLVTFLIRVEDALGVKFPELHSMRVHSYAPMQDADAMLAKVLELRIQKGLKPDLPKESDFL